MYAAHLSLCALTFLPAPKSSPVQVTTPAEVEALVDARVLIERHLAQTGEVELLTKTSSSRVKGKIEILGTGISGPMEVLAHRPDRRLVYVELAGVGSVREGFDGTTAWSIQPMQGPSIRRGAEGLQTVLQANYLGPLMRDEDFERVQTLAKTEFNGRPCWKVELIAKTPPGFDARATLPVRTFHHYFDVETGLLAGKEFMSVAGEEQHQAVAIASDYRELDGRLVSMKTTQKARGQTIVITTESISFDDVQPAAFRLPEEISHELARQQAAANLGREDTR